MIRHLSAQRSCLPILLLISSAASAAIDQCHILADRGDASARDCYLTLLQAEDDDAVRAEALWRMGDFEGANRAFHRAAEAEPENPDIPARWGMLFLAAHQAADAEALFEEALNLDADHIGALLGQAELLVDRFSGPAKSVIEQVLTIDPDNAGAQLLQARLLVEASDLAEARNLLLPIAESTEDPKGDAAGSRDQLAAMALLAAADHMDGRTRIGSSPGPWTEKALALNPHYGDIHAVPAHYYVITRRYHEAVALLKQAVAVDPHLWSAHTALGTNLLRINRIEDGKKHLEQAYRGDAFNAETVNTLRLLDSLAEFDEQQSDSLILRTHPDETAVLTPYVDELVKRTVEEMAPRYGYKMTRPVVLELYQHHDDFAVRTAGLPGLGILGATFGDVVVMDGPSAKGAEQFDWYSAVWHELAHVVTLNATNNLVSRWFSEGVSVHEEQRFGPSPNESVPFDFLDVMSRDRLLPVTELDQGFMRPEYPNQIGVSYVQAGLLCTFIADNFENGLRSILQRYRAGDTTAAAVERGLGLAPEKLDQQFFAHLEIRYGQAAGSLTDFKALGQGAAAALREQRWAEAQLAADQAIALFPSYVGPMSPHLLKARAARGAEDMTTEREATVEYFRHGGRKPDALTRAARLLFEADNQIDALEIQRTLARLDPLEQDHHATLGDWLSRSGHHVEALTEYKAVLALQPHDMATAHYRVASALHALGRTEKARRELLYALEIAPRFSPALSLLVEINQ